MNNNNSAFIDNKAVQLLILLVCLAAVLFPRFDRRDLGIEGMVGADAPSDAVQYVSMVSVYRGTEALQEPEAPFTYRPLVPWLASMLPAAEMTSINIINVSGLALTVVLLGAILAALGCSGRGVFLGRLMFVLSFPVFYYGAIGIVDPPVLACIAGGAYLALQKKYWQSIALLALGACIKETVVVLIPFVALLIIVQGKGSLQAALYAIVAALVYAATLFIMRQISLDPVQESWTPSLSKLLENASRSRAWLSFALSLGLPGLLTFAALLTPGFRARAPLWGPLLIGMLGPAGLFGLAMVAAYADGRFVWPAVIFSIPLAILWLEHRYPRLFTGN